MWLKNRKQAGLLLSAHVVRQELHDPLVLALPRGGVPVAREIAEALGAPLDVLIVRKVGAPGNQEYGIGAITEDNHYWIDPKASRVFGEHAFDLEQSLARERAEVRKRVRLYRNDRPLPDVKGRSVVVVDDGLATGVTARVACAYLRKLGAEQLVLAVPVASPRAAAQARAEVDQLICLAEPEQFSSVGQFYEDFRQLEDAEVLQMLKDVQKKAG